MALHHKNNLRDICAAGRLLPSSIVFPTRSVANQAVKDRRTYYVTPDHHYPTSTVSDHVPFYVAAKSPMVYAVTSPGEQAYKAPSEDLVFLGAVLGDIDEAGLTWCVSNGNAASGYTDYSRDLGGLGDFVDFELLQQRIWRNTPDDPYRQGRRAAECLVLGEVPLDLISVVIARTEGSLEYAGSLLSGVGGMRQYTSYRTSTTTDRGHLVILQAEGDLLAADVEALVNTVNCVGVMGKGIALQFKRRYPDMFEQYERECKLGHVQIGHMLVVPTGRLDGPQYVINFPTKKHWRSPSRMEYIEAGLVDLRRAIVEHNIRSIAIPPLGAGNGGLDWEDVRPRVWDALGDLDGVSVHVYAPSRAPRTVDERANLRMSWGRALLLDLLQSYVRRRAVVEPWEDASGASHLEIQKLMYLANEVEPKLRLDFKPGRYGPYSEQVRHLVQDMEGAYLAGHGDGSAAVLSLDPIAPTQRGLDELRAYRKDAGSTPDESVVHRVLDQIAGYEGPYGLELLSSTHWVIRHGHAYDDAPEQVRSWTRRKARIFTDQHVRHAAEHLEAIGAI